MLILTKPCSITPASAVDPQRTSLSRCRASRFVPCGMPPVSCGLRTFPEPSRRTALVTQQPSPFSSSVCIARLVCTSFASVVLAAEIGLPVELLSTQAIPAFLYCPMACAESLRLLISILPTKWPCQISSMANQHDSKDLSTALPIHTRRSMICVAQNLIKYQVTVCITYTNPLATSA